MSPLHLKETTSPLVYNNSIAKPLQDFASHLGAVLVTLQHPGSG